MSRYSMEYLNNNTLIGFTAKRGNAWHRNLSLVNGLDNHYSGGIPAEDIATRLFDWEANESPVFVQVPDFSGRQDFLLMPVDNKKAYVRSDNGKVLGIHSEGHTGHAYKTWLIENLMKLVGGGTDFANAGLLADGAQAWVQIEMPENIEVPGGVTVRPFLLATTSFDGSIATTFKTGFTNVVCDNTYGMFMREQGETYKRKHTKNSEFDLLAGASALNTLSVVAEQLTADIESMLSIEVSDAQWSKFVQAATPIDETSTKRSVTMAETKRSALTGLWRTDMRVAPWAGTAWGVVQAVNTYNEHLAIVRNADGFERKMVRAVKGQIAQDDRATMATLATVLGRELVTV